MLAPDPPVVTLTDTMATGVTVGWNLQGGVDSYEVLYNRSTGSAQQGACPDFVDMGSATADGGDTSLTLRDIEEFSSYTITVIAVNRIASIPNNIVVEFMTPSAGTIIVSNSQGTVLFSISFPQLPVLQVLRWSLPQTRPSLYHGQLSVVLIRTASSQTSTMQYVTAGSQVVNKQQCLYLAPPLLSLRPTWSLGHATPLQLLPLTQMEI